MISSRAPQRVVRALDLAVAHRDRRLAQEAARAVVEQHDQLARAWPPDTALLRYASCDAATLLISLPLIVLARES